MRRWLHFQFDFAESIRRLAGAAAKKSDDPEAEPDFGDQLVSHSAHAYDGFVLKWHLHFLHETWDFLTHAQSELLSLDHE